MARKGYRLWQCDECQEKSWHHWIERNRAARMRCPRCGCSRLDIVTNEGHKELIQGQRNRVTGDTERKVIVVDFPSKANKVV